MDFSSFDFASTENQSPPSAQGVLHSTTEPVTGPVKRGAACHQCRKKKLKCNAERPLCQTCAKAHSLLPPGSVLPECTWDELKPDDGEQKPKRKRARKTNDEGDGEAKGNGQKDEKLEAMEQKIKDLERLLGQVSSNGATVPQEQSPPVDKQYPPVINGIGAINGQGTLFDRLLPESQKPSPPTHSSSSSSSTSNFHLPPIRPTLAPNHRSGSSPSYNSNTGFPSSNSLPVPILHSQITDPVNSIPNFVGQSSSQYFSIGDLTKCPFNTSLPTIYNRDNNNINTTTASNSQTDPSPPSGNSPSPFAFSPFNSSGSGVGDASTPASSVHSGNNSHNTFTGEKVQDSSAFHEVFSTIQTQNLADDSGANIVYTHPIIRDVFYPGWCARLPEPELVDHLVRLFFDKVPTLSRALHKGNFMASLTQPPTSRKFPHEAVLHAICAVASKLSLATPIIALAHVRNSVPPKKPPFPENKDHYFPDNGSPKHEDFGEKHLRLAHEAIEREYFVGERLFDCIIAVNILSAGYYYHSDWVRMWLSSGLGTRLAVPLGLNESLNSTTFIIAPGKPCLLPAAANEVEAEERRRMFWAAFMSDRLTSASSAWAGSLDEHDITTELPSITEDFVRGVNITPNRQTLASPDLLVNNPIESTDAYVLHVKSAILVSRVQQFSRRWRRPANWDPTTPLDPRTTAAFKIVDSQTTGFTSHFPEKFKDAIRVLKTGAEGAVDPDLFQAHNMAFLAVILLHEPHVNFLEHHCQSASKTLGATRGILLLLYQLSSTTFDITLLHPFICFVWFTVARTLLRFYEAAKFVGDPRAASAILNEVHLLRGAMEIYSTRWPLGASQVMMLDARLKEAQMSTSLPGKIDLCGSVRTASCPFTMEIDPELSMPEAVPEIQSGPSPTPLDNDFTTLFASFVGGETTGVDDMDFLNQYDFTTSTV